VNLKRLNQGPRPLTEARGILATVAFAVGGALLLWSSYIHFHLWQSLGYRHIPTIGALFLVQSIVGVLLALLAIVLRRAWTALLGFGFALMTMLGFVVTVSHGLFGFKDSWSAPFAHEAFVLELLAMVAFVVAGALCVAHASPSRSPRTRVTAT
jgi:hypothetical protein